MYGKYSDQIYSIINCGVWDKYHYFQGVKQKCSRHITLQDIHPFIIILLFLFGWGSYEQSIRKEMVIQFEDSDKEAYANLASEKEDILVYNGTFQFIQ